MTGETKIVNLYRGGQDGLQLYTTEDLNEDQTFWVPSHELMEDLSGRTLVEIRSWLEDPENEKYLPYQSHLIAYVMDGEEEDPEDGVPAYRYVECPERTYARIDARESSEKER